MRVAPETVSEQDLSGWQFQAHLSGLLTEQLRSDDVQGMLSTLAEAGLSAEHLGGHLSRDIHLRPRGCCRPSSTRLTSPSSSVSFSRVAHLSMLTQSSQVLSFLSVSHPRLLMMLDDSGSGVLHCLAMASVLLRSCASSRRLSAGFETFQTRVFRILSDAECPSSDLGSTSTSLLHSLCLMENSAGLRPIEFSILVGAYSTFHCILNVQGYILTKQVSHGIRVRSTYDLTEYDLMKGDRRDKSPMLMLTLISSDQADPLAESGLLETPVIKKWMKLIVQDMRATFNLKRSCLSSFCMLFSPLSFNFLPIASTIRIGFEYEAGFYRYAELVKSAGNFCVAQSSSVCNASELSQLCQPSKLFVYLTHDKILENKAVVVSSPLLPNIIFVNRIGIVSYGFTLPGTLAVFALVLLVVLMYNAVRDCEFSRRKWMRVCSGRSYLVQSSFYNRTLALCFCAALLLPVLLVQFGSVLDCTDFISEQKQRNALLSALTLFYECFAVLLFVLNMFNLIDAYEMIGHQVAFLNICFRRMLATIVPVLLLLVVWAYLVFGTLFYIADFKGQAFLGPGDVFYTPLRILMNTASLPIELPTAVLHTLFVLTVSINVLNFFIATLSKEFATAAVKFDIIYTLSLLNCSLRTWRLYAFLTRSWRHCVSKKSKSALKDAWTIRVWTLKSSWQSLPILSMKTRDDFRISRVSSSADSEFNVKIDT